MSAPLKRRSRVLVAIASFGTANDRFLQRLIKEYRAMSFDTELVVLSNLNKTVDPAVELVVGLPTPNPWSLPFAHKKIFVERVENYDLFIYSEDDTLITEKTLLDFMEVSGTLNDDEIAGFLRFEEGPDGNRSYPDVHGPFHWDPASLRVRGEYTLAHFTNEHAACYVLTQDQLRRAIASGRFNVPPHEWKYDLLCTAATDPYTQCGFTKLIPISHFDRFTVHHLPNKYVDRLGVNQQMMNLQISALMEIGAQKREALALTQTETKLKHGAYSKDYYEPLNDSVVASIPKAAQKVLSIGVGSGEMECTLLDRGLRVAAVPLDSVISSNASSKGVEMTSSSLVDAHEILHAERFDCIIYSKILHLMVDPVATLSLFSDLLSDDGIVVIHLVNMLNYKTFLSIIQTSARGSLDYDKTGVHFSSGYSGRQWCRRAGLVVESMKVVSKDGGASFALLPESIKSFFSSEIVLTARNTGNATRPKKPTN
jgi:2-polyprenyl-3-methyl-5-hydroxy-6-metoxy-1,4-benzoquinol methylase